MSPGSEGSGQRPHSPSLRLPAGVRLRGQRLHRRLRQLAELHQLRGPGLRLPQRLGPSLQEAGRPLRGRGRRLRAEWGPGGAGVGEAGRLNGCSSKNHWQGPRTPRSVRNRPSHGLRWFAHSDRAHKHELRCNATVFWLYIL